MTNRIVDESLTDEVDPKFNCSHCHGMPITCDKPGIMPQDKDSDDQ